MRFVHTRSLLLCFIGLLLFFSPFFSIGQGPRELYDPTLGTTHPRTTPSTPPAPILIPVPSTSTPPNSEATFPTSPSILGGISASPISIPISDELRQLLGRNPSTFIDSEETSAVAAANAEMTRQILTRLTSVMEAETEDEREERELSTQRQQAEQVFDPIRREAALEPLRQMEIARQNRLTRRAENEVGADLFYHLRLKEQQYLNAGWCQLFDGHTDFGWKVQDSGHYAGGKFTFGQGEIGSDPFHPGMVYTKMPFGDIALRFDYWVEKGSEVLLLLKTPPNPADLNSSCYTIVLHSEQTGRPRGLLLGRHGYSLPDLRAMRNRQSDPVNDEEGTWHSARVRIDEGSIQVEIDKRDAVTYFDPAPISSGHIAFLVAKGQARFYNIIWQPAQTVDIFDTESGEELAWQRSDEAGVTGDNTAGFRLQTGSMESKNMFGNYVLQMQYFQGGYSGNSSLFVRGLPGQENTGYEISLQNFPRLQDRESAIGVDAGSFRLRKDARYIRAQDLQWTYLTVAVMGRQLATWVNGVPVCEIEDKRTNPFPPGTGPYLQPGAIRLAVPEDNTSFQFRRLAVAPVP